MTESPPEQVDLLNQVIQLSAVDREFRQRLLREPAATLQETGLDLSGKQVTVREFDPNELSLILPPFLEEEPAPPRPQEARAEGEPSPPRRGLVHTALDDPTDDRALFGASPT